MNISIFSQLITIIIAGIVIVGVAFQILPIVIAEVGAIMALLLQIFQENRTNNRQFLTSPLFLLGTIAIIFYSLIPIVSEPLPIAPRIEYIGSFFGSTADRLMIIFGLSCLIVHGLISGSGRHTEITNETSVTRTKDIYIFSGIALVVSLANVINFIMLQSGGPNISTIRTATPPLLAFCLVYLVYLTSEESRLYKLMFAGIVLLTIGGLFVVHEGKIPVFILVAALLYGLRLKNIPIKNMVASGVVFALVIIALLQIMQAIRIPHASMLKQETPSSEMFKTVLHAKIVWRQTETRFCLHNVIDEHRGQPFFVAQQFFWLKGLVPRALWPNKPNLSLGNVYAKKYCGQPKETITSGSITLLGQPIINGGLIGLLLHGGILITCLGGAAWLTQNPHKLSAIVIVALLPWLIDFDQHFTMFFANAAKFFLVMLPLIIYAARQEIRTHIGACTNYVLK